ncbi:MAG TPA: flagellar biosynthesis protein FlgN [Spirochaetia bacterium]
MGSTEQNIAVLKRLREMLSRQRDALGAYLSLLENEKASIERNDTTLLLSQVEMERSVIENLASLRKVIVPLEALYREAYPAAEETVPRLKASLDAMQKEVIARNEHNRRLLRERMEELRGEITSLRGWPREGSPFTEVAPTLVDITT